MIRIKRIIVPIDFSPAAANALKYAIAVALDYNAKVFLVHIIEDMGFNAGFSLASTPVIEQYHHGMEDIVKKRLQEVILPDSKQPIEVERVVVTGKPFLEILRMAKEESADLIVMATHGTTGKRHVHLGSTLERVVSRASCPVLAVHLADHDRPLETGGLVAS